MPPAKKKKVSDSRKFFKIEIIIFFSLLATLKSDHVRFHIEANYETFTDFYKNLQINDAINKLASNSSALEIVENPR